MTDGDDIRRLTAAVRELTAAIVSSRGSTVMTYTIEEAAARLGPVCSVGWIKSRLRGDNPLPHLQSGTGRGRAGRIAFTEAHLAEILLTLEVRPEGSPAP